MDRASTAILAAFLAANALFALLVAYLVHDQRGRRRPARAAVASAPPPSSPRAIGRIRLGVVALSFLVWSLVVAQHVHPRH
jgi:hypothetical protein